MDRNLLHPDLANISEWEFRIRTSFFSRLFYCKPSEYINWWGGDIRPDGGQGMYATRDQHERWPHKVVSDVKIGPG